jgi:hypothetical protein
MAFNMLTFLTILISFLAFVVALFSLMVSEEKFRLDLYNKRFEIYVRTVKFYQSLMSSKESKEKGALEPLQQEFILASRESQFLFDPTSGVYDLLYRLNMASLKIIGSHDMPKGLPVEQILQNQKELSDALILWNSSMERLESLMAPYLNYHYASTSSALIARMRDWSQKMRQVPSTSKITPSQ